MGKLVILASIIAFVFAVVIFGGAVANDAMARSRNAAANELQAKAALEIARGQSEAIITRANAEAYSDRALANVPIWILAFVLGIVGLVAAIVVIVRFADRPQAKQAQEVIVLVNGKQVRVLLEQDRPLQDQIDAAVEFAYYATGGFVDSRLTEQSRAIVRY